ncbi:hypothetical protein [Synechococcus sp. HK01-R]|uniref:hypothetical protein n=1 Tax=Synechococcus sp. HK01-R TaxID=2751171 RepID=UPI00162A32F0|nr:hypothetical protein [Synechococcus sp. HK01-R]QNG25959.1 hypothetical protein H0O21_12195 [Synechococcus sp. HK01-R]
MEPAELLRCQQRDAGHEPWGRWGTYLSDRQWGRDQPEFQLVHSGASYMTATSLFADGGIMMSSPGL